MEKKLLILCEVLFYLIPIWILLIGYFFVQRFKRYKKYTEISFKIGDIFKSNDFLSHNIIWLFMVYNDLMRTFKYYISEKKKRRIDKQGTIIYILRLDILHLKEGIDMINKAKRNRTFAQLIKNIHSSNLKILKKNTEYGGIKVGIIYDKLLIPLRKSIGHYLDSEYLNRILNLKSNDIEKILLGKVWGNTYFRISDEIIASYIGEEIKKIKYKDSLGNDVELSLACAIEIILEMMGDFLQLVHEILLNFYKIYIIKHSTEKNIRVINEFF